MINYFFQPYGILAITGILVVAQVLFYLLVVKLAQ